MEITIGNREFLWSDGIVWQYPDPAEFVACTARHSDFRISITLIARVELVHLKEAEDEKQIRVGEDRFFCELTTHDFSTSTTYVTTQQGLRWEEMTAWVKGRESEILNRMELRETRKKILDWHRVVVATLYAIADEIEKLEERIAFDLEKREEVYAEHAVRET